MTNTDCFHWNSALYSTELKYFIQHPPFHHSITFLDFSGFCFGFWERSLRGLDCSGIHYADLADRQCSYNKLNNNSNHQVSHGKRLVCKLYQLNCWTAENSNIVPLCMVYVSVCARVFIHRCAWLSWSWPTQLDLQWPMKDLQRPTCPLHIPTPPSLWPD